MKIQKYISGIAKLIISTSNLSLKVVLIVNNKVNISYMVFINEDYKRSTDNKKQIRKRFLNDRNCIFNIKL